MCLPAAQGGSAAAVKGKAEVQLAARRPAERLLRAWGGTDRVTLEHTKEAISKCLQVSIQSTLHLFPFNTSLNRFTLEHTREAISKCLQVTTRLWSFLPGILVELPSPNKLAIESPLTPAPWNILKKPSPSDYAPSTTMCKVSTDYLVIALLLLLSFPLLPDCYVVNRSKLCFFNTTIF